MARHRKEKIKAPEGPLSRELLRNWYVERFRKGTMVVGLVRQSPIGKQNRKVSFLILSEPVWASATLRSGIVVDRFSFEALTFVDGKHDAKMSGTKAMICEVEAYKSHVKGLSFFHVDDAAVSDIISSSTKE